jgi:hypothetical protein
LPYRNSYFLVVSAAGAAVVSTGALVVVSTGATGAGAAVSVVVVSVSVDLSLLQATNTVATANTKRIFFILFVLKI